MTNLDNSGIDAETNKIEQIEQIDTETEATDADPGVASTTQPTPAPVDPAPVDPDLVDPDLVDPDPVAAPAGRAATAEVEDVPVETSSAPDAMAAPRRRGRARRMLRFLLRLVVALAIIGALVAAVVFGWPEFDERVLQRVDATASDTAQLESDLALAEGRIDELDARIAAIAGGIDQDLDALSSRIEDGLAGQEDAIADQRQVLQAMDLLSRARLYLYQANYGFAEADIATASGLLGTVADPDGSYGRAVERLDAAVAALPTLPVVANDEVNVAWSLLLGDAAVGVSTPAQDAGSGPAPVPTSAPPTTDAP